MKLRFVTALTPAAPIILIAISIACTASRSASAPTQPPPVNQTISESPAPLTTSSTQERTPCTLGQSAAPNINRLKLGMTVDEILALFPGSKEDADLRKMLSAPPGKFNNSSFSITPAKYGNAADFKDVTTISFSLLDGRISGFTMNYSGPKWPDVDKFVEQFVAQRELPPAQQWEPYVGMETQLKTLTCTGFSIRIFASASLNYVLLQDIEANNKLKERRKKAQEQASPTPAP